MSTEFTDVSCWGYSLAEYRLMFALTDNDLQRKIIDCAAGPSSFNAELFAQGGRVISCDPIYALSLDEMKAQSQSSLQNMQNLIEQTPERFIWKTFHSASDLLETHQLAIQHFLQDFSIGEKSGRYCQDTLPQLSQHHYQYQLALCSHFLFIDQIQHSVEFHVESITEMCRVANEVRIYPLLNAQGDVSQLVGPVMMQLQEQGYGVEIKEVPYQYRKGANAMMRIWGMECPVVD